MSVLCFVRVWFEIWFDVQCLLVVVPVILFVITVCLLSHMTFALCCLVPPWCCSRSFS